MSDNPIDILKSQSLSINNIIDYSTKNILDYSRKNIKPLDIKLSTYYEAEDNLVDYSQAVTLYGVRRTGKTTVLEQLWDKFKTDKSVYLYVQDECGMEELMGIVNKLDADYLFIDEITRVYDMETHIHIMLDLCSSLKTKIVLAGTDSYILYLSMKDSAYGRYNLVRFLPIRYRDLKLLHEDLTFYEYYRNGLSLTKSDIRIDVINTVYNSVQKIKDYNKCILSVLRMDDFKLAMEIVVTYLIGVMNNRLPSPVFRLNYQYYNIESDIRVLLGDLPSTSVNAIYNMMLDMDLIKIVRRFSLDRDSIPTNNFYLTVPSLYFNVLSKHLDYFLVSEDKYGYLYEATAITQILVELDKLKLDCIYYSIRDSFGAYEVDLCIVNESKGINIVNLIEFKQSSTSSSKHLYNKLIDDFYKDADKVNKYLVHSLDKSNEYMEDQKEVKRVSIERFLDGLEEYLN